MLGPPKIANAIKVHEALGHSYREALVKGIIIMISKVPCWSIKHTRH